MTQLRQRSAVWIAVFFAVCCIRTSSGHPPPVSTTVNGVYTTHMTHDTSLTWAESSTACANAGGWLTTAPFAPKLTSLLAMKDKIGSGSSFWMGADDLTTEGTWKWSQGPNSGDTFYTTGGGCQMFCQFLPGEPNNQGGTEHCMNVFGDVYYNDGTCDYTALPNQITLCDFNEIKSQAIHGDSLYFSVWHGVSVGVDDASKFCKLRGGFLPTLASAEELSTLLGVLPAGATVPAGISDSALTGTWTVMGGQEKGTTTYVDGSGCAAGRHCPPWGTGGDAGGHYALLSQATGEVTTWDGTTAPVTLVACQHQTTREVGFHYRNHGSLSQAFYAQMRHCAARDAELANPYRRDKLESVTASVAAGPTVSCLLGASDEAVGLDWRWVSGAMSHSNGGSGAAFFAEGSSTCSQVYDPTLCPWHPGEPNGGGTENYLEQYELGHWNDVPATSSASATVCEKNVSMTQVIDGNVFTLRLGESAYAASKTACQNAGGWLAAPSTAAQYAVLLSLLQHANETPDPTSHIKYFWLAYSDAASSNTYQFDDGPLTGETLSVGSVCQPPYTFCDWAPGQPSSDGDYVHLLNQPASNRVGWNDILSSADMTFLVCQHIAPFNTSVHDGVFYSVELGGSYTRWLAEKACEDQGGALPTPLTLSQQHHLESLALGGLWFWLGISDEAVADTWVVTGGPAVGQNVYSSASCDPGVHCNWDTAMPSGAASNYVRFLTTGKWSNVVGNTDHFSSALVCQFQATSSTTPTGTLTTSPSVTASANATDTNTPSTTASNTVVQSASESVRPTLSPEPTHSTSVSPTASIPDTATPSVSPTRTSTASVPLTPSVSIAPTHSAPVTGTPTTTVTVTPSPTTSQPETHTLTPQLTVSTSNSNPATASLSVAETASFSLFATETLSVTSSSSETDSLPQTSSAPVSGTRSQPLTNTPEVTDSLTEQVFCGQFGEGECVLKGCLLTDEGACYAQNCTAVPLEPWCLMNGCAWTSTAGPGCEDPPSCRVQPEPLLCEMRPNCRWNTAETRCYVDKTLCHEYTSSETCTAVGCSFNSIAMPSCFKPISVSSLCSTIGGNTLCQAQGCVWLSTRGACAPWDVECPDLPADPITCASLPLCSYDPSGDKCITFADTNFDDLKFISIVGISTPATALPNLTFTVRLFGSQLGTSNPVVAVSSASTACPLVHEMPQHQQFFPSEYDPVEVASVVSGVLVRHEGNYSFCVKVNASHVLGPFGNMPVKVVPPVVATCRPKDGVAYAGEYVEVELTGERLGRDGMIVLAEGLTVDCSTFNESSFFSVLRHNDDTGVTTAAMRAKAQGNYTVCYLGSARVAVGCKEPFAINGVAPWNDETAIVELLKTSTTTSTTVDGVSTANFNDKRCKTNSSLDATLGVAIQPMGMEMLFGDGTTPYAGDEVCMLLAQPLETEQTKPLAAMYLDINFVSLEQGDEMRVFTDTDANTARLSPVLCTSIGQRAPCLENACQWSALGEGSCDTSTSVILKCPTSLEGKTLSRVLRSQTLAAYGGKISLPVPRVGVQTFICSSLPNEGGSIGVGMEYRRAATYCPNDCKDADGTTRGSCEPSSTKYVCKCSPGFQGEDCSRRTVCNSYGSRADKLVGDQRTDKLKMSIDTCGYIVRAVPTAPLVKFGIAFALHNVSLSSYDCATNYIMLRSEVFDGPLIRRLCKSDLDAGPDSSSSNMRLGELLRKVLEGTDTVYLQFQGAAADSLTIDFGAVATACPGLSGDAGYPVTEQEQCHGRGRCLPLSIYRTTALPLSVFECQCRSPYSSTFIGETCNTCGMGFMKRTFPACNPATVCASNCTGHGTCVADVGCHCFEGWYGLDCALLDDRERLGTDIEPSLRLRLPMNFRLPGNVVQSGSIDRTISSCALPGSVAKCKNVTRATGRLFPQQQQVFGLVGNGNRRVTANDTSAAAYEVVLTGADEGMSLNSNVVPGMFPSDYVRVDNVSADAVAGTMTIAAWAQLTLSTEGVLFAVVDTAFNPDGRSPPLEKIFKAVESRAADKSTLDLATEPVNVHMAIVINGPQKRIDLLVTDHKGRKNNGVNETSSIADEEWMYVRHFRLGDSIQTLFDGSWRHFVLKLYEKHNRFEARVYIDGYSIGSDPDYMQCVPFLPVAPNGAMIAQAQDGNLDDGVTVYFPGAISVVWGYRYTGSLDELQLIDRDVPHKALIDIANSEFVQALPIQSTAALAFVVMCAVCLLVGVLPGCVYFCKRKEREKEAQERALEEQQARLRRNQLRKKRDAEDTTKKKKKKRLHRRKKNAETVSDGGCSDEADIASVSDTMSVSSRQVWTPAEDEEQLGDRVKEGNDNDQGQVSDFDLRTKMSTSGHVPVPQSPGMEAAALRRESHGGDSDGAARSLSQPPSMSSGESASPVLAAESEKEKAREQQEVIARLQNEKDQAVAEIERLRKSLLKQTETIAAVGKRLQEIPNEAEKGAKDIDASALLAVAVVCSEALDENIFAAEDDQPGSVSVLHDLQDVVAEEERLKQEFEEKENGKGGDTKKVQNASGGSAGAAPKPASTSSSAGSATVNSSLAPMQMLGQATSTMQFPVSWDVNIGAFFMFLTMDLFPSVGAYFAVIYFVLLAFSWASFGLCLAINARTRILTPEEIVTMIDDTVAKRREFVENGKLMKPKTEKAQLLVMIIVVLLSALYMPATQQSLMILFCHPNISCLYDCYNDEEHKTLVVFAVIALLTITAAVPVFYFRVVRGAVKQYMTYIGTFDQKLQSRYWETYASVVQSPFSSLWDKIKFDIVYFEVPFVLFRAVISCMMVGLNSESFEQMFMVLLTQIVFTVAVLVNQPYLCSTANGVLSFGSLYVVCLFMLQSLYILDPADSIALAMIIVAAIGAVILFMMTAYVGVKLVKAKLRKRKLLAEYIEEEEEEEGDGEGKEGATSPQGERYKVEVEDVLDASATAPHSGLPIPAGMGDVGLLTVTAPADDVGSWHSGVPTPSGQTQPPTPAPGPPTLGWGTPSSRATGGAPQPPFLHPVHQ